MISNCTSAEDEASFTQLAKNGISLFCHGLGLARVSRIVHFGNGEHSKFVVISTWRKFSVRQDVRVFASIWPSTNRNE